MSIWYNLREINVVPYFPKTTNSDAPSMATENGVKGLASTTNVND
jgi:hypothetical protein